MLDRFTDQAKRVVVLAREEARMLSHHQIGAVHILLGLIREGGGVVGGVLESVGITLEAARQQVAEIVGQGQPAPPEHIGFTPGAKLVLVASLCVSRSHGSHYIGTEHLLLALTSERVGVVAQVLDNLGASQARVQWQVLRVLGRTSEEEPPGEPETGRPPGEPTGAPAPLQEHQKPSPVTGDPGQRPAETVPMVLVGVRAEMPSNNPVVLLKEAQGDRYLPIFIGAVEAAAIAFGQQGVTPNRPLAHDLLYNVLEAMGVRLVNVTITSRVGGIFYSDLSFSNDMTVSSRPSDAIALAVRTGAAILVNAALLDDDGVALPDDDIP
jgi:bifunctional DNase/RNase